jgi:hypothetical protein
MIITILSALKLEQVVASFEDSDNSFTYETVFHESLHLFGLSDRYDECVDENGNTVTTSQVGFHEDTMGVGSQTIGKTHCRMYSQYFSGQQKDSGTLKHHVDNDNMGNLLPPTLEEVINYNPFPYRLPFQ